jgi:hypothetical protein
MKSSTNCLKKISIPTKKPQQVVDLRLFSCYRTSLDIIELWSYLCDFINTCKFSSRKFESIKALLGNDMDKMLVFVTLNGIVDFLSPIEKLQKSLQTGASNSHKVYKIMQNLSNRFKKFQISDKV